MTAGVETPPTAGQWWNGTCNRKETMKYVFGTWQHGTRISREVEKKKREERRKRLTHTRAQGKKGQADNKPKD